jgi:hypothetical protein
MENEMPVYQYVKIPTTLNEVVTMELDNLDDAKEWAMNNLDTSTRWIIKLDGVNRGEAFTFVKYNAINSDKAESRVFNHNYRHPQYFDTKEEALNDRKKSQKEADVILNRLHENIKGLLNESCATLDYVMEGDTHGIYENYQYIEVKVNNYYFRKRID